MSDKSCVVNGIRWYKYLFEFKTADGTFGSHFYAISDEHAAMMLEEMKETAKLLGRHEDTIPANDR
jgi:hypothetical protein